MKRSILFTALLACLGFVPQIFSIGLIVVPDETHRPEIIQPIPHPRIIIAPPRPHAFAPLEMNYAKVTAHIKDQIAVTQVEQEFYNPNSRQLEGTFIFPAPKGARIDRFTMEIDGKQVEAELLKADQARRIYEEIVRRAQDPALLEYAGRDLFKARIFPIEARGKKRISLSYSQLLPSDGGLVNYILPLNTAKYSARPIKNVSLKLDLETKRPLKTIYSPSHTVEIKRDGANKTVVGYEGSEVKPDADFHLYFSTEQDELGLNLLTSKTRDEDGFFVLLVAPGIDRKENRVLQRDVVFVLDTSGSMAGKKLEQARKALHFCVENLNDGDRFEIIRFSTEVEPLFDQLLNASRENRGKANRFIDGLKPIGGTAIDDALGAALELRPDKPDRPFVVIFLTDGLPTIGTTDENQIVANVRKARENTRVFCFGIGSDVNTHLLDKIAEETRAFSQYVLAEEDIEVKVSSFFTKIKEPVLANPTLKFSGAIRATKIYPTALPDIFRGEQLVVSGRYSGKGAAVAILEGAINGETKKFTYDLNFSGDASDHEFIPRLWATRRVGYLLDEIRLRGESAELRDEVTELASKYGIVTPYTAYLILEDEARRNVPQNARLLQSFGLDLEARQEAHRLYDNFKLERAGEQAVAGARSQSALKRADGAFSADSAAVAESSRALGLPAAASSRGAAPAAAPGFARTAPERVLQYSQQTRYVSGKNFFQNGALWTDAEAQKNPEAKRVRIQFNTPEYFELIAKNPKALPWLALGQNVQFVSDGVVYEIYGEAK
jgi:Ca-activated chloride channel homolog